MNLLSTATYDKPDEVGRILTVWGELGAAAVPSNDIPEGKFSSS
jgi:hypothetical protein